MGEQRFRGDNRNDPIAGALASHPEISAALETRTRTTHEEMQKGVCDAIQNTDERKLAAWVAVCVWEDSDGKVSHSVIGDDHSSFLELKGYLHDGVWAAAHADS